MSEGKGQKNEGKTKKGRSGGQGGEESQLLWFLLPFSTTPTSECCAKGHPVSMYAKRHCGYTRFKNQAIICSFIIVLIENTTVSAQIWAYPSQDVFGQWRPSELVKYAQRDEDHLRAAGHGVNAKTWWLRKHWHVEHFPRPATGSAAAASSMDILTHQPTQTRVWKGKKKVSSSLARESCDQRMDTLWQRETHLNCVGTHCHTQAATPPCPLLSGWQDGWKRALKIKRQLFTESSTASIRVHKLEPTANTHWHTFGSRALSSSGRHLPVPRSTVSTHLRVWLLLSVKRIKSVRVQQSRI